MTETMLPSDVTARNLLIQRSRTIKRTNAITAAAAGCALAALGARVWGVGSYGTGVVYGLIGGLLYANVFEYVLHRYILHWNQGFLARQHAMHHNTVGASDEPRYVNFASSPWVVVLLFVSNAVPVFALESALHLGVAPGMLIAFTAYYALYEEIHWRMHLGGWLPAWLQKTREHHMLHHGEFEGRYNVFLPLCDWIFQRHYWKENIAVRHRH